MTRPIYEPTTPRTMSAQGYTGRQLLRRPRPTGGGMWPWINLRDGSTDADDNTITPIPFGLLEYDPALITQGEIFDWAITDSGDPGVDRFVLYPQIEGFYYLSLITTWGQITTNGTEDFGYMMMEMRIRDTGETTTYSDYRDSQDWLNDTVGGSNAPGEQRNNPYLNITDVVYIPNVAHIVCEAMQTTGSTRTLEGTQLFAAYIGTTDSDNWVIELT